MNAAALKEIQDLHQLGTNIGSAVSLADVLQSAASSVAALLPCDRVCLIELNTEKQSVEFFAKGGKGKDKIVTTVEYAELLEGLTGWVIREGVPALSPKAIPDPRESETVRQRRVQTECGSVLVVPLRVTERTLGTMTAINGVEDRDFDQEDVELMLLFANYCAIVIENTRVFLDLKKTKDDVENLNKALQQQNSLKDRLFAILAHDLKASVATTCTLLDTILQGLTLSKEMSELSNLGKKSAYRTYDLLENLLEWIRGQLNGESSRSRLHLVEALNAVHSWILPQAEAKGITVVLECPEALTVFTDATTVETIVRNLVSNALKYSPHGSKVTIQARTAASGVLVEVRDHGKGIPPERVAILFGDTRVHSEPGTNDEQGNGLGLMFSGNLARGIGGRLEAESVVGQGSTFRLVLPAGES